MPHALTPTLEIAFEEHGPADGPPVVLLHGFPYDPRAYDEIAPALAEAACHAIVPYLRGYGPTRFRAADTPRSGQQAALARDALELLDALQLEQAVLVGYDWGGRGACIAAALWPERVRGLVTVNGYNIQDIPNSVRPAPPEHEHRAWYQYYFHTERGRAGLTANRRELCRLLWRLWSPTWHFDDETYARTATSFDNPDFVEVVIHSYRHRYGYAAGDPAFEDIERALAGERPTIGIPTIALIPADDGVSPYQPDDHSANLFTGGYERRVVDGAGHNLPQEKPETVISAVTDLLSAT